MFGRRANDLGAVAVGQDQPGVFGKYLERHMRRGGEEQPVAMPAIVRPFAVDAKILDRRFDFDDPELAEPANSAVISSATSPAPLFRQTAKFKSAGKTCEIVVASPEERSLVYTDSTGAQLGFVNVTDAKKPRLRGILAVGGEPTSVAFSRDGNWVLAVVHGAPDQLLVVDAQSRQIARRLTLPGQPDCISVSPDGRYAAIAIENERLNMEKPMPQGPPGLVVIVDLVGAPDAWKTRTVSLPNLPIRFPTDPEPEYVAINSENIAAFTLQENNGVVTVDLKSGKILESWSCGNVTHAADLKKDKKVDFSDQLKDSPREPDGIEWTPAGNLITANEGDYEAAPGQHSGGRNFTIFSPDGEIVYDAGAELEKAAAQAGLYDDKRSEKKGIEPETVKIAKIGEQEMAFIACERGACVMVYDISDEKAPQLLQILAAGKEPEGLAILPTRGLVVAANEGEGTLSIWSR